MAQQPRVRVGVDTGGTFTDFVVQAGESLRAHKVLSTPSNPAEAIVQGLSELGVQPTELIHGSTVATNAVLERRGAKTALITTKGFRDVLEIGRQNRPEIYNLFTTRDLPLVPRHLRFEVEERVNSQGDILAPLDRGAVEALVPRLKDEGVESVAVCFLFSFLRPEHEELTAQVLQAAGFWVTASHQVLREYREFERTSTTCVNAYVSPLMARYLSELEKRSGALVRVMRSGGGMMGAGAAGEQAVHTVLSGPAGGVAGALVVGRLAAQEQLISFDMGGTSTDVSLLDGAPTLTTEAHLGGCPVRIPVLDIHSVGAGGGSIAHADAGGALRVGPRSAGAAPGPACYGRGGTEPTVTDANLVLGRLPADWFLGGHLSLDEDAAREALARLGLDVVQAAMGIVRVVNANMERAIRVISVARGHDPRQYALLSFGGAGGLHACALARSLAIPRVIVPWLAATLSAYGMLAAPLQRELTQTVLQLGEAAHLDDVLAELAAAGLRDMAADGADPAYISVQRLVDMRYVGQSFELTLPYGPDLLGAFHQCHQQVYGHSAPEAPAEVVNARLRLLVPTQEPRLPAREPGSGNLQKALLDRRRVVFDRARETPLYAADRLRAGDVVSGPALVIYPDSTLALPPGDQATMDQWGNLIIELGRS